MSRWFIPSVDLVVHPPHNFFFFSSPATADLYTLSLHDALPISAWAGSPAWARCSRYRGFRTLERSSPIPCDSTDRKSTRLNSSHLGISYAVFCLKKKK